MQSACLDVVVALVCMMVISCTGKKTETPPAQTTPAQTTPAKTASAVTAITSEDQFKSIVDTSGNRLLIFDLYADWCVPCKILSPLLEELATENSARASFYKVDIERHRGIASAYNVMGIPYVIFIKNKKTVHSITGVSPKEKYLEAINTLYQ